MVRKRKLEKIKTMLQRSGMVDHFEKKIVSNIDSTASHLLQLQMFVDGKDLAEMDVKIFNLDGQIAGLQNGCGELCMKEMSEKKQNILHSLALIYDGFLSESEVDEVNRIYESDIWNKMVGLQSVLERKHAGVMLKYEKEIEAKVLDYARPNVLHLKAKYIAKIAFKEAIEGGKNNSEALDIFSNKYREVIKANKED